MKVHLRFWIGFGAGVFLSVAVFVVLILSYSLGSSTVANSAEATLSDVRVKVAGELVWRGDLDQGERHRLAVTPQGDGTVEIAFSANGESVHKEFGYVTPHSGYTHMLAVLPSFEVDYWACSRWPFE